MSKLPITPSTVAVDNVRQLDDQPTITPSALKQTFDQYGEDDKNYTNNTLISELNGDNGSKRIGHSSTNIVADNVNEALEENRLAINDAILGQIPDGSLTKVKLDDSLSSEIDQTTKRSILNTLRVQELEINAAVTSKFKNSTDTFYDYEGSDQRYSIGSVDHGKAFAETVTQGTNTLPLTSLISTKDGSTPTEPSESFGQYEEVTLQGGEPVNNLNDNGFENANWDVNGTSTKSRDGLLIDTQGNANLVELPVANLNLANSTLYTMFVEVLEDETTGSGLWIGANADPSNSIITSKSSDFIKGLGIAKVTFTTVADITGKRLTFYSSVSNGNNERIRFKLLAILEGDQTNKTITSELGLGGALINEVKENLLVDNINDGTDTLTFTTNIQNTYPNGAVVYRSNLKVENDVWKMGGFTAQEVVDITTPVQVVASAYSTQGNGGRKACILDNQWIIASAFGSGQIELYVSKDNGTTFNRLCFVSNSATQDWALVSEGNNVHICFNNTTIDDLYYLKVDAATVTDTEQIGNATIIDNTATDMSQGVSLAINEQNGKDKITVTYSTKDATYPNSFNIRAIQGTISAGVVTWGSVEQLSDDNSSGVDNTTPSIVYNNSDFPTILYDKSSAPDNLIRSRTYNGASWDLKNVYDGTIYAQSNPSATFIPPSVATLINASYTSGLIVVTWQGFDSTDAAVTNIRCSASSDNGSTWFDFGVTNEKITSGNTTNYQHPTVSWNESAEIFIVYDDRTSGGIYYKQYTSSWSTQQTVITGSHIRANSVDNYHNFENPITIFEEISTSVKLYGKYTIGSEIPLTDIDTRMNIEPLQNDTVTTIQAWSLLTDITGVTNTGFLSIVGETDNESYIALVNTDLDLGTDREYFSTGQVSTANEKVTYKANITRQTTSDDVSINYFYGGVV